MASEKPIPPEPVLFGGSCACGRMKYESLSMPKDTVLCHCALCRKLSGGPYQCYTDCESKKLTFYDMKENLRYEGLPKDNIGGIVFMRLSKVGERAYCVDCYTPLAMRYKHQPHITSVTLSAIDEKAIANEDVKKALEPISNIFVSQKGWWVDAEKSGLPCRARFGGDFEQDMKAWEGKEG